MRSDRPDASPRDRDLTTRARIRDAAILLFGREGFDRTSIRAVAAEAGVSAALVMHHFASKDGLRAAANQALVDAFLGEKDEILGPQATETMQRWLADIERYRPLLDYLARVLADDSPAADELFDALLDGTRQMLDEHRAAGLVRPSADPEMLAVTVTLHGIIPLLVQRQLARALGDDALSPEVIRRMTLPTLELYTHGIYTDDRYLEMARTALRRAEGP